MIISTFSTVNVKWGKEKFTDIECSTDEPPMVFKAQLFALSGVQPERQKVMMKGAVLKVWYLLSYKTHSPVHQYVILSIGQKI